VNFVHHSKKYPGNESFFALVIDFIRKIFEKDNLFQQCRHPEHFLNSVAEPVPESQEALSFWQNRFSKPIQFFKTIN
jgi:hypothetical protein